MPSPMEARSPNYWTTRVFPQLHIFACFLCRCIITLCFFFFSGEGSGTPLQYSCLENPMDGGAWWAAVHGVARSRTRLSDLTFTFHFHSCIGEGNGNPLQCSCLENPRDGGAWWAAISGVTESDTTGSDLAAAAVSTLHIYRLQTPGEL